MKLAYALYGLIYCLAAAGCSNNSKPSVNTNISAVKKPILTQPFRFHKRIEVAPGMDYDVLSWGRGTDSVGAYLILRSDSAGRQYTTTTGDLDGAIKDVFNTDLDSDGNPEIFIQSQTADSTGYGKIDAYEYNDDHARKLEFPKLNSKQKKGYHGGDVFTLKEDTMIRTIPIYDSDNRDAKLTGEKRILEYSYHGNSFSVKQVNKEKSTDLSPAAEPVTKAAVSNHSDQKSDETHQARKHERQRRESRHHEVSKRRIAAHHRENNNRWRRHRR